MRSTWPALFLLLLATPSCMRPPPAVTASVPIASTDAVLGPWRLFSVDGAATPAQRRMTLDFRDNNSFAADIACNHSEGTYSVAPGVLHLNAGPMTLLKCDTQPTTAPQIEEQKLLAADAVAAERIGGDLLLRAGGHALMFRRP